MDEKKLLETISKKLDGVADDVRTNSYRIDKLEATTNSRIDKLEATTNSRFDRIDQNIEVFADKLSQMSKQFTMVTGKVIDNDQRLENIESRVAVLEGEAH